MPQARRSPGAAASVPFPALCRALGLPEPVPEYRFALPRRWRIDWAWPDARLGLEVDGGVWTRGRHTRGSGWVKDSEKLNTAAIMGWRMLRCTPQQLPGMVTTVAEALAEALASVKRCFKCGALVRQHRCLLCSSHQGEER